MVEIVVFKCNPNSFQEAKEAKLLQEAMTTVPEMDNDDDSSPPVDSNQLQGMSLSELKKHRKLLKKGLKVNKVINHQETILVFSSDFHLF